MLIGIVISLWDVRAVSRFPCRVLNNFEIRKGRTLGICMSVDNCRLFVGGIPKKVWPKTAALCGAREREMCVCVVCVCERERGGEGKRERRGGRRREEGREKESEREREGV